MSLARKRALSLDDRENSERKISPATRSSRLLKLKKTEECVESAKQQQQQLDTRCSAKARRQAWTTGAIDAFFEGLYQNGKNFDRILKHMKAKQKKINDPVIANLTKDQVRFFYYRTWHKVEPLLTDPSCQPPEAKKPKLGSSTNTNSTSYPSPRSTTEVPDSTLDDEEGDNFLDSSIEDADMVVETLSPKKDFDAPMVTQGIQEDQGSPLAAVELEREEKINKDQLDTNSLSAVNDKVEGKVKDTVMVNGTRQSVDLVALVCYNKLKKKCPGDHNLAKKLSELVYQGTTTIPGRNKGKRRTQIKIPNCGAFRTLKRHFRALNEEPLAESAEVSDEAMEMLPESTENTTDRFVPSDPEPSVETDPPSTITVELRPLTSATWHYVQGLSQNPRLRLTTNASRPFIQFVQFLCNKWQLTTTTAASTEQCESLKLYHTYNKLFSSSSQPVALIEPGDCVESLPTQCTCSLGSDSNCMIHNENNMKKFDGPHNSCLNELLRDVDKSHTNACKSLNNGSLQHRGATSHTNACKSLNNGSLQHRGATQLEIDDITTTLGDLHCKFHGPDCLKFFYQVHVHKQKAGTHETGTGMTRTLLKLAEYISDTQKAQVSPSPTKSHTNQAIIHSPKMRKYMRSLAKRSPRKSPLSKYHRLKTNKSPYKARVQQVLANSKHSPSHHHSTLTSTPSKVRPIATNIQSKLAPKNLTTMIAQQHTTAEQQFKSPSNIAPLKPGFHRIQGLDSTQNRPPGHLVASTSVTKSIREPVVASEVSPANRQHEASSPQSVFVPPSKKQENLPQRITISPSALKPFGKPRRPKKMIKKSTRQLVPRPLLFLPKESSGQDGSQQNSSNSAIAPDVSTQPLLDSHDVPHVPRPTSIGTQQVSSVKLPQLQNLTAAANQGSTQSVHNQNLILSLLQTMLLQHQQRLVRKDASNATQPPPPHTTTTTTKGSASTADSSNTASGNVSSSAVQFPQSEPPLQLSVPVDKPKPLSPLNDYDLTDTTTHTENHVHDMQEEPTSVPIVNELKAIDLDTVDVEKNLDYNFLFCNEQNQQKPFNTSSDTVNMLLRGLSSMKPDSSLQKLTDETASVLPTFAKALEESLICSSSLNESVVATHETNSSNFQSKYNTEEVESGGTHALDLENRHHVISEASSSALSDFLGSLSESGFVQGTDGSELLETLNAPDVLDHLRGALVTPSKPFHGQQQDQYHMQSGEQNNELANGSAFGGTYHTTAVTTVNSRPTIARVVDSTCRSLLEENSIDYLQRFKEMASRMDNEAS